MLLRILLNRVYGKISRCSRLLLIKTINKILQLIGTNRKLKIVIFRFDLSLLMISFAFGSN